MKISAILFALTMLLAGAFTGCARREIGGALPLLYFREGAAGLYWDFPEEFPYDIAAKTIRVLISTTGFASHVHERVEITGTGVFEVWGGGKVQRFSAGEVFTMPAEANSHNYGRFYVASYCLGERLKIVGLVRNHSATPEFRGIFQIAPVDGGFTVVNELLLEEYLYAVVPSEMPSSFGVEASKVQAVTARTFAVHQMRQGTFVRFGADVDDSVISQVYNNLPETDVAIEAVRATRGRVLKFGGDVVIANYFSTSGGTTANFGEVWAAGAEFPTHTPEFLRARAQLFVCPPEHCNLFRDEAADLCACQRGEAAAPLGDLRTEEAAAAFFRDWDVPAFEREFPWFRWKVTMSVDELSARINENLPARHAANPAMIEFSPADARAIGTLKHLEVTRRGQGGNIMEMVFYGSDATARVRTEFNIRTLLNPRKIPVKRHDSTFSTRLTLLPSAFFSPELHYDKNGALHSVTFFGGGNGHGVGKSQNGVRALLDMGLDYMEILRHFYPGVEVVFLD